MLAYRLLARRDVGAGTVRRTARTRLGRDPGCAAPLGLAWRLDRGALVLWTVGLCLYGLLIGSVVHGIGDEIGDSESARDIVARLGGTAAMEQAFIAVAFSMLGMVAAAFAISLTLRLHQEESSQRAETAAGRRGQPNPLAGKPSGDRPGRVGGRDADRRAGGRPDLRHRRGRRRRQAARSCSAPPPCSCPRCGCWPRSTVALFGLVPRFTPVAWGVLVGFIALYLLGSLSGSPQWLLDLEPFAHTPRVGDGTFTATPLLWLLAIDIGADHVGRHGFPPPRPALRRTT